LKKANISYSAEEVIPDIIEYQPQIIHARVSYLRLLAETIIDNGIDRIRPKGLMASGEVLDAPTRKYLEAVFNCPVFERCGAVEIGTIFWQCTQRESPHINDLVLLEVVRNNEPVGPGEVGDIVITGLGNYVMPFIRYRLGDRGILDEGLCSCGRSLPLLKSMEGRSMDHLSFQNGRTISPKTIMTVIQSTPGVSRYRVVQESPNNVTIELMKRPNDPPVSIDELTTNCQKVLGNTVDIKVTVGTRERLKAKFRPVISKLTLDKDPRWTQPYQR
jgi:phenylacetate-CoA ligase